jgi:hypothetical protein
VRPRASGRARPDTNIVGTLRNTSLSEGDLILKRFRPFHPRPARWPGSRDEFGGMLDMSLAHKRDGPQKYLRRRSLERDIQFWDIGTKTAAF